MARRRADINGNTRLNLSRDTVDASRMAVDGARFSGRAILGAPALWRRVSYLALLACAPLLPAMSIDAFSFPGVVHAWTIAPLAALFVLPFVSFDRRAGLGGGGGLLAALLGICVALAYVGPMRTWPIGLLYACLAYLAVRMIRIALRPAGAPGSSRAARSMLTPRLPLAWLLAGIVVLSAAHVGWALHRGVVTDVGAAGVQGATRLTHGLPLYGDSAPRGAGDSHTDTYGPANYELYVPLASVASPNRAARLTTLMFDLATALLLFLLGVRARGPAAGTSMAYCWLACPLTAFEVGLGFNDALAAASLVGVLLVMSRPGPRGALAAVCCWVKFSPLALLPLWATAGVTKRNWIRDGAFFAAAFAAATAVIFLPVIAHGSVGTFVARTFGYQRTRPLSGSIWDVLQDRYALTAHWLTVAAPVVHGLLVAGTAALALLLPRLPVARHLAGLAAASAAVLLMVEMCLNYFAFSYTLWFLPLVLVVLCVSEAGPREDGLGRRRPGAARSRAAAPTGLWRPMPATRRTPTGQS
jgi:hypothetical protein